MKSRQRASTTQSQDPSLFQHFRRAHPQPLNEAIETIRHQSKTSSGADRKDQDETQPKSEPVRFRPVLKISGLLCVIAMALYGLAVQFGDPIAHAGHSVSSEKHEIVVANTVLNIPANVIRYSSQRKVGEQSRLELYFHWPSFSGYTEQLQQSFNDAANRENLLFVTIEPRVLSLEMSGRIGPIYSKFLTGPAQPVKAGLLRQSLSAEGGFIDEDLYFEANSPYPYATRCIRRESAISTPFCIRDIHIGTDLMLTYRFHSNHLENWLRIETDLRKHIKGMMMHMG